MYMCTYIFSLCESPSSSYLFLPFDHDARHGRGQVDSLKSRRTRMLSLDDNAIRLSLFAIACERGERFISPCAHGWLTLSLSLSYRFQIITTLSTPKRNFLYRGDGIYVNFSRVLGSASLPQGQPRVFQLSAISRRNNSSPLLGIDVTRNYVAEVAYHEGCMEYQRKEEDRDVRKETDREGRERERCKVERGREVKNDYHSSCNAVRKRVVGHPL